MKHNASVPNAVEGLVVCDNHFVLISSAFYDTPHHCITGPNSSVAFNELYVGSSVQNPQNMNNLHISNNLRTAQYTLMGAISVSFSFSCNCVSV